MRICKSLLRHIIETGLRMNDGLGNFAWDFGFKAERWSRIPTNVGGSGGKCAKGWEETQAAETYVCDPEELTLKRWTLFVCHRPEPKSIFRIQSIIITMLKNQR